MARASFWQQLKALLKRNVLLKRRNRTQSIQEIFMPIYFIAILAMIRALTAPKVQPVITDTKVYPLNDPAFNFNKTQLLYITPDSSATIDVAVKLAGKLGLTANPPYKAFASVEESEQNYLKNPSEVFAGIEFGSRTLQDPTYTLRLPSEKIVTTTREFTGFGVCREDDGLQNSLGGCPANTYLFSAFTHIQLMLDTLLIQMSASASQNASVPELSVQMMPKPEFKPNTISLQILSSIYFVLAYSVFIAFLSVNLVTEKQKKIKEAMRMMGLRDSAFWLSWGLIYALIILVVTSVVTLLAFAIKLFENSNFFIFFIMLLLYGLSIVNLAFAITPFFAKAETAGAAASLSTIFMSLLYMVVLFTKDGLGQPTIPVWALYLLCLLSPLALSLSMDTAVLLDVSAGGMNFTTIKQGVFPLQSMIIMLAVDVVLYGLLAFYFDNVIPNEYGTRRPPWFFLMPSYWCPPKARSAEELQLNLNGAGLDQGAAVTVDTDNMEAVSPDFRNKNVLRIFDMRKTFKVDGKEVKAVQGISLDIYEGQITALLGHNGAGKTTLIHMLTGMSPATSGSATIYGLDVSDSSELTEIRTMIGLCPQHNILFDDLTPREHLDFYGNIKGVDEDRIDAEITEALRNVDMLDQMNTRSKTLSGGQKRKLCVAIALIGNPKVVFLDEPTAGMDPSSRRHLWRLLKNQQKDKLIVLTTHFMDEADILADRKAVISKGKLQCVGSSLFLKNRFGIGYHLSMVLEPSAAVEDITDLVRQNVPHAEEQRHHGKELTYTLPIASVSSFPKLFGSLEEKVDGETEKSSKLGVRSYGVSMTTLEEVFLKLGEEAEAAEEEEKNEANNRTRLNGDHGHTNYATTVNMENNGDTPTVNFQPVTPGEQTLVSGRELNVQRAKALFKIRWLLLRRIPARFVFQVIFPLLYVIGGCAMLRFIPVPTAPSPTTKLLNSLYIQTNSTVNKAPMLFNSSVSGAVVDSFNSSLQAQSLKLDSFQDVSTLLSVSPHFVGLQLNDINNNTQVINSELTVLYNDTAVHSIPSAVNALTTALLKMVGNAQDVITTYSKPWPWLTIQSAGFNGAIFGSTMFLGVALASIPGGFGVNIVQERTTKVKSQLRLAGVKMNMYWGTVFAFDALQFYISCLIVVIVMLAFQIPSMTTGGAIFCIILMYIGYVPANLFTAYGLGYMYDKFETAQSSMPSLFIWSSLLPFLIVSIVDMVASTSVASGLHYAFCVLFPTYPVTGCYFYIDKLYRKALAIQGVNPTIYVSEYFATDANIAITIFIPMVHCVLLYFVVRMLEVRSTGGSWKECVRCGERMGSAVVPEANNDMPADEDEDVAAERIRVNEAQNSNNRKHVIGVKNLRKEFKKEVKSKCCSCKKTPQSEKIRVAVRNSSFLVEPGEVLGLLGPNGAGKTTTLNMVISETAPTCGKVDIAGYNIQSNLSDAFQCMGYCPQHDALWEFLHLREHIECYAAVRGIPSAQIKAVCNYFMDSLEIKEHADKRAKNLSGGTKRKLSYIVSMLGDPKIVLLDEPSTGMDPKSKRFLWDTISAAFNNDQRGAILTTHYMDEADALCSRVAIMVNGEIECLGSTQHLKDKFGGGYHLEIKLQSAATDERAQENQEALHAYVQEAFPGSVPMESFGDRAQYRIPQAHIESLGQTFLKLENAKTLLSVEEYSFSQATLEQVFLEFAKNQVDEGDQEDPAPRPESAARTRSLHRQLSMGSPRASVIA